jgi:nucleoid DNA-binding protein
MKVNKPELIQQLHDSYGYTKKDAAKMIDDFVEVILNNIEEGNSVSFHDFGEFGVIKRAKTAVRDVRTGELVEVAEHYIPKFYPRNGMKAAVKTWEGNVKRGID